MNAILPSRKLFVIGVTAPLLSQPMCFGSLERKASAGALLGSKTTSAPLVIRLCGRIMASIYGLVLRRLGFEDIPGRRNAEDINRSVLRWIEGNTDKPSLPL